MASITKKPNATVSSATTPARNSGTQTFTSTWKIPTSHTSNDNVARMQGIEVQWQLGMALGSKNPWISRKFNGAKTDDTLRLNSGWTFNDGKSYDRSSFWPYTDRRLYNVHAWIRETNSKGNGPWLHLMRPIADPYTPDMDAPEMAEPSGVISTDVSWDKDNDGYHDADRCQSWIYVTDTTVSSDAELYQYATHSGTSYTLSYNPVNRMALGWDDYIKVTFRAIAQGWRGDSKTCERTFVCSYPSEPTVQAVDVSGTDYTSKVTALIDLNTSAEHPVTGCVLEILTGTTAQTESQATAQAGWTETGATDDGACNALAITAQDLLSGSSAGTTIWVRVKSWNNTKTIFYRYSKPQRVTELEIPAVSADSSTIVMVGASSGDDGKSALVSLVWDDGGTPMSRTELTWSSDPYAWKSTNAPSSHEFGWSDGAKTVGGTPYPDSADIYIRGLDEGTKYYVRARRVLDGDPITYSNYTQKTATVVPATAPSGVALTVPEFIARGESLPVSWTYDSDATQKAWAIVCGTLVTSVDTLQTPPAITETWTESVVVASGNDALGSTSIDAARVESLASNGEITLAVRVSVGGEFVQSHPLTVKIAEPPAFVLTVPSTVTAQPIAFTVDSTADANLRVVVTAQGAAGDFADGSKTQMANDTVYSGVFVPNWSNGLDVDHPRTCSITLPTELDIWDGAYYTVSVVAVDAVTGLESDTVTAEFNANWSHQASAPGAGEVTITPHNTTVDGFHSVYAHMAFAMPFDGDPTDVYDVYRITPDGVYSIAQGVTADSELTDWYAPYTAPTTAGECGYRVAKRTTDGDTDYTDYLTSVTPSCDVLRIDFGSQYIELPWNIVTTEGVSKDFEARAHLGADTAQGYWNENTSRKTSFATDVIRLTERAAIDTVRELARYSAPCFVRVPNGQAYQANIDVSGLEESYNGGFVAVSLDGVETALTDYLAEIITPEESS